MSRRAAYGVFTALIFAIALGFALYGEVHWLASLRDPIVLGSIVGRVAIAFGASGVPAFIYWAMIRFRAPGLGLFLVWAVLCTVFSYFASVGAMSEFDHMPKDKFLFVRAATDTCLNTQVSTGENRVRAFASCTCFARQLAEVMVSSEMSAYRASGHVPSSLQEKIEIARSRCLSLSGTQCADLMKDVHDQGNVFDCFDPR